MMYRQNSGLRGVSWNLLESVSSKDREETLGSVMQNRQVKILDYRRWSA